MKTSLTIPNIANLVHAHVAAKWPELASDPIAGLWFTGSQVWSFLYPDLPQRDPPLERDWDMFVCDEATAALVVARLNLPSFPACRTQDKRHGVERTVDASNVPTVTPGQELDGDRLAEVDPDPEYHDGFSYLTDRGEVDLWITRAGDAVGELRTYPDDENSHCRAAFSFSDGLLILPNERAK